MKRHWLLKSFMAGGIALSFSILPAENAAQAGGGYGAGGCGPGAVLMPKNTIVSQTLAAATNNGWSGFVTSGMTSGTSGCNISGFVQNDEKLPVYFAEANMTDLTSEMAQGEGEKLAAFAQTFGCAEAAVPRFMKMTRENFSRLVPSADGSPEQLVKQVRIGILDDSTLAGSCAVVASI